MGTKKIFLWLGFLQILVFLCLSSNTRPLYPQATSDTFISGEVKDEFGGLIVGAEVKIKRQSGSDYTAITNEFGRFRFEQLDKRKYLLRVAATGFADYEKQIDLNFTKKEHFSITLYPTIKENVEINRGTKEDVLDSETISGTIIISEKQLADLPDDPEELSRELQNLASSSGSAPGNAIVTVDGFLSEGRLPSKSAIREVRVNPNLFSAEYNFPPFQGGRIEIITKPGSGKLTGSAFFNFNDDVLNARNPFAKERAETNTKRYGLQIGSPILKDISGFFVDLEKRDIDESSTVNAVILDDNFQTTNFTVNVPNPQRLTIGSVRNDWKLNKNHSLIFSYRFNSENVEGQGIGGIDLPDRAFDYKQSENILRFSETAVINAKTVNEFRIGLTLRDTGQNAISDEPVYSVAGAFTSGGADFQKFSLEETDIEISNNLITEVKNHILKIGTQIFKYGTNDFRRENQNGTFFFGGRGINSGNSSAFISGLEQYRRTLLGLPGGIPTRFSVNLGEPSVSTNQWLFAAFIQDEWRVNKKVLISLGLRAESQTLPKDKIRFAPRVSIAYSPDKKQKWALRGRAGIFYGRISDALRLETGRLNGINQQRILIDDPTFPDPFLDGTTVKNTISVRRILDPKLEAPGSLQLRIELQRQLPQGWSISSSYSVTRGWSQFHSRNINAPIIDALNPNPQTAPRPFGVPENILQFESSGNLRGKVLYIGVNQNSNKYFSINAGYLNFDFKTDTDGAFSFPQSGNDLSGELARSSWHERHRIFFSSSANLPWNLRLSSSINASSGMPFNITTGRDNNGDGIFNDRPDLTSSPNSNAIPTAFGFLNPDVINGNLLRNIGTNAGNFTVSMNLRRTFVLKKSKENDYRLTANIRTSNLLNRTNLDRFSGVLNSPFFGRAFSSQPSRQIEFGLRFNF